MSSYIPTKDADLLPYAKTFAAGIEARPEAYGLMASDAVSIRGYVQGFEEAMATTTDPATRTRAAVAAKDGARAAMLAVVREYAQIIKRNTGVSNDAKIAIGVPIANSARAPVPAPTTRPLLTVMGAAPLSHTIRFSDASTPDARGKPPGALAMLLFKAVGKTPPADPEQASFVAMVTKQPFQVSQTAGDVGLTAYYFAKWVTRTGQEGPWSSPASMTVAA